MTLLDVRRAGGAIRCAAASWRRRHGTLGAVVCLVALAPARLDAQRGRASAPAPSAQLEVISDTVGQPIRINGALVGVTPAILRVPAPSSGRVEVGSGVRARTVTMDFPAQARIRMSVTMPRDTAPLPSVRTIAEVERDLAFALRLPPPVAPIRPIRPEPPAGGASVAGGLLLAGAAAALSTKVCEQRLEAPPGGIRLGGTYYPQGSHGLGPSSWCVGRRFAGVFVVGAWTIQSRRRANYRRAADAFGAAEARWLLEEVVYADAMAQRAESIRVEVQRELARDEERRRSAVAQNEQILRANRDLPVVTFLSGPEGRVAGARTALVPPELRIVSLAFADADGDSVLTANERASVDVRVLNSGEGAAVDVRVNPTVPPGLRSAPKRLGTVAPGDTVSVTLELTATADVTDGPVAVEIEALEGNGFDADPFVLRLSTLGYRPPQLVITDVGVEDALGRSVITPGTAVEVTVRVQNRGGASDSVQVVFERGDSTLFFTAEPMSGRVVRSLGRLRAGEVRDVTLEVIANRRATGFPLRVGLVEASGRFGVAARDLGLTLLTPQRALAELRVTGAPVPAVPPTATPARPLSSILAAIPTARVKNPDAFAVIIGNRRYRDAPDVDFALNDASAVRQYAERALGIRPGNIIEASDATKATLEDLFGVAGNPAGRLKSLVTPGKSDVFVFYSGHGAPDPQAARAYLLPVDANANRLGLTGYALDLLYENLAALGARHVTVVLDACFTGSTVGGQMLITAASPIGIRVNDPSARFAGRNATVIAASAGQQLANWFPEQQHGMLTYFFLRGLQGGADRDGDGRVSVGEMKSWLQDGQGLSYEARRLFGRDQTPQVWGDAERILRPRGM